MLFSRGSSWFTTPRAVAVGGVGLALVVVLLWAYWPTLGLLRNRWTYDPRYAHGYLVPAFAVYLLRRRRGELSGVRVAGTSSAWWGLVVIGLGAASLVAGRFLYNDWLSAMSLLPCLAGVTWMLGGTRVLRWAAPAIAFLTFMVPLPYRFEIALGGPLHGIAARSSTFLLQSVGLAAVAEGNIILTDHGQIGVVEACSGLSMMLLFVALATGVAILVRRPWGDRVLLIASAVPIALLVNILRITVTGVLGEVVGARIAHAVYHDLAGWLMMPTALFLLGLELWLLDRLLVEVPAVAAPTPGHDLGRSSGAIGPFRSALTRH